MLGKFCVAALMTYGMALGQAPVVQGTAASATTGAAAPTMAPAAALTFDVASVRPSADLRSPAAQAAMRAGNMPKFGPHVEGLRAEYNQMQLRDLIAYAYQVKLYQVSGPDAINGQRFDIAAKMPEGSTADDAPGMLRALLEDRFKLKATSKTENRPVLALIVGKNGPKMQSVPAPPPLDDKAELKPGERRIDTPDGPAIMTMRPGSGGNGFSQTMNMGAKGTMSFSGRFDAGALTMHVDFSGVTMSGFSAMLTQMMSIGPGGAGNSRPVVDMTGLAGNYDAVLEFSQQFNINGGGNPGSASGETATAPDPGGNGASGIYDSVQKMGLKLDQRKAPLEQVVVTHVEKMPTDN
jgi:uncharacterized protein (TIGR03435 family)